MKITSYNHEFDVAALPEASVQALLTRGFNHVLGNEVASRVTAFKDSEDGKALVAAGNFDPEAVKAKFRAGAIEKIMAGTLGVRAAGVQVDPVEAEMDRLATDEIKKIITANGYKWNKPGKGEPRTVTLPDGAFTMEQLVERRLAKHGERIRAQAEKNIKAKDKELAKLREAGETL